MGCRAHTIETRAAHAMPHAQRAFRLNVGAGMTKPLQYRWKGFEEAAGVVMRGMRTHNLFLVEKAQRKLAELRACAGGGLDLNCRLVRTLERHLRAGDLLVWFERDLQEAAVERALPACRPILHYLNVCLQAESLVTRY